MNRNSHAAPFARILSSAVSPATVGTFHVISWMVGAAAMAAGAAGAGSIVSIGVKKNF